MDLDRAAAELYALPPSRFTAGRDALVAEARQSGDKSGAEVIKMLKKPTLSAWLADLLARQRPEALDGLIALGASLRTAQRRLDGDELRRLTHLRHEQVAALLHDASQLAREADERVSEASLVELQHTLEAAVADDKAAAALRSGRLARPLQHSGVGLLDADVSARSRATRVPRPSPKSASGHTNQAAKRATADLQKWRRQRERA
ncbi:MAG TPA: hypothetical protein VEJ84_10280, partial [Acidimicrobiales bacterium]|nr:hypothetical protein [Acidimicrobiales bacterium]